MVQAIATFESRYHLRAPLFWILFAIFFLLTFGAVTSEAVQIGGSLGNVNRNAPFVIMQFMLIMSVSTRSSSSSCRTSSSSAPSSSASPRLREA